jgi:hypothetical protein
MKSRATALLSLLLLVSAVFGLPVTRGGGLRCTVAIVCEHRERRVEQTAPPRTIPPLPLAVPGSPADAPAAFLLDYSLFQRPPPAA